MESAQIIDVFLAQPAPPAMPPAIDYGFWSAVSGAGLGEKIVMLLLLGFSVVSWAIIAYKARSVRRAYRESETFLDVFWSSKRLDAIYQRSETLSASPVSQVFRAGYIEL